MGRFGSLSNWNLQPSAESQASLKSQAGQAAQDQYNALLDQSAAQLAGPAPSAFLPAPITTSLNPQWSPPPEAQYSIPPVPTRPAPQGWLDSASRSFQTGLAGTGGMLAGAAGLIGNTDAQAGIQKWTSDTIQGLAPEQYARPEASMGQKILDPDWWKTTAAQALGSGAGSMGVSLLASAPLIVATAFAPEIAGAVGISVGVARVIGILSTTLGRAGIDSVMESASAYQDARQSGKSESEASQIASTVGANNMLLNVGLEAIPGFGQLANVGKAITKGAVRGGVIKALEQEWGDVAMAAARQRLGAELTQQGWMTGARNYAGSAARGAVEEYLQERQQGEIQRAASDGRPWDLARALTSHELDDDGLAGALISLAGGAIGGAGSRAVRAGRSLMSPSPQLGIQGGGAIGGPPVPEQPRTLQEVLADVESNDAAARAMRRGNNAGPSAMANLDARSADLYAELVALAPPGAVKTVEDYLATWTVLDNVGEISEAQIVRDLEQGSPIPDKELFGKIVSAILTSGPQFVANQQNEWMYVDPQAGTGNDGSGGGANVAPSATAQDFSGQDLRGRNFSGQDLTGAKFGRDANLSGANLTNANLTGAWLTETDLANARLTGATLTNASLRGASLRGTNLSGAILSNATLTGANLLRANLAGANLSGANLSRADLIRANFTTADLTAANLTKADLTGADLPGAILSGAILSGANFANADLTSADLTRANLTGADLTDANLTGANLTGANLTGAELTGAFTLDGSGTKVPFVAPVSGAAGTATTTTPQVGPGGGGVQPPPPPQPPTANPAGEGEDKFQTNPFLTRTINRLLRNSPAVRTLFEGGRLIASKIEPIVTVLNQQLPIGQKVTAQELADYVNQNILGRDQDVFDPSVEYDQSPGNAVQPRGNPEELPLRGETYDDRPLVPGTAEYAAYVQRQNERRGIGDGSSTVQDTGDQGALGQDEDLEQPDDVESDLSVFDFDRFGSFSVAQKAGLLKADFQGVAPTGTPWPGSSRQAGFSLSDVNKLIAIKRPAPVVPAPTTRAPAPTAAAAAADREYKKSLGDALFDPDIRNEVKTRKPGPEMSDELASHLQALRLQYPTKTIGNLLADMRDEAYRIEEPVRPDPVVAPQTTTSTTLAPARVVAPPRAAQGPVRGPADTASFPFDKSNDGSYRMLVNEAGVQGGINTGDGFRNFDRSLEEILLDKARPLNERTSAVTNLHSMYEALVKEEQKYYPDREEAASRVRYRLAAIVAPEEMADMEDIIEDVSPEGGDRRRTIPFVLVGVSGASEDALFRDRRNLEGLAQAVRKANDDGSIADGSATDVLRGVQYLHSVRVSNSDTGRKTISGIVVVDTASTKGQSDGEILEQLKMAAKIGLQLQPRSEDAPVVIGRSVQRDPVVGDVVELLASHAGNNPGTTGMVTSIGSGTFNSAMAIVRIDGAHGNTPESSIPLSKLGVYEVHDDDEVAVSGSSATEPTMDRYTVSGRRRWTIANAFQHVRDWTSGATMRPVSTRRLLRHIWGQNAKDYQTEQEVRSELVRGIDDQNAKDYRTREEVARELGRVRDVAETDEQFEARVQAAMASERSLPSARQNADAQFEARVKEEMEVQRSLPSARQEALTGLAAEMASLALDPYRNAYLGTDDPATKVRKIRDLNDRFGDIDINEDPNTGAGRYNLYLLTLKELNVAATGYGDKWSEARANGTPAPEGRRERSVDEESIEPFTVSEKDREFFQAELNRILEMRRGQRNAEARSGSESSGVDEQAAWIASLRESERTKPIRSELTREEIALQNPELDAAGIDALMQEYQLVPFMSYRAGSIDQIILSLARPQPKETVEAILSTISDAADMFRNARSGNEKITDTFAYYLGGLLGGRKGFKGGVRARGDAQTILDIFTANRGEGFRNAVMRFAGEQALNPTQNFYLFRTRFSIALADAGFWKWRPDGTLYDRIAPDGGKFQKDQRVFDPSTNSRGRVLEDQGLLVRMTIAGGRRRHVQNVSVRWSSGELHGQTTNIHPLDITLLGENGMPQKSLFTLNNPMPMDMRMGTKISVPDAERLWGRIAGWDTRLFGDSATASTKLATIFQDLVSRNIPDKDADAIDDSGGDMMAPRRLSVDEENEARKKAAIFLAQMVSIHGSPAGTSSTTISDENMTTVVGVLNGIDRTGATARAFNEERMRWARQTPRTMNDIVRQGLRSRPDTITEMVGVDDDIDDDATVIADAGDEYDGKKVPRGMQIIERPMTASDRRISAGARRLVTAAWRGIQSDDPDATSPVNMNIGMRDDQDRHITNKSTAVRDPLTRSRMSAIADVLGRSGLLGNPMRQADVRREGAIASNQARASQVTEDMIRDETSRDTFFMQYYRDNLMGGQNDGVTATENMARLFATWSDANADLASGRQFIDGDLIARYLHAVSPEPKENSKLKPVAGIVNRVLALMNQSNRALLQEANRDSDQARKDALLAVHASAKAEVVRFQEAHARLIGAPETAEQKAATVQEALPVLVANQMAANRVVGPLDRAMVQATQVPDAVETDPTVTEVTEVTEVTGVTEDGVAPVEPDPKETAAKIEAYLRANPGRTKGQIARGTRLTVLQVEGFLTTPGTSAVASGKSGGHATYSIGTAEGTVQEGTVQEETVQEEPVQEETVQEGTVQEETVQEEPVAEGEATVQDPMWETAKLFMKTTARTIGQISNKLGGNDLAGTRALIDAHIDEIQVIAGARIGVQDRYRMLDAGEAKVEPVRPVAPGRRGAPTATEAETGEETGEEGTAVAEGTEGQTPEVQLEEVTGEDGEDEYDGPYVDIVGETSIDGFGTRRTRSRQPRATTPQWSSIQDISAGIAASGESRIVVLAVSNADEARRHLQHGVNPATFGAAFAKGMQPEGATAEDVILAINKSAGSVADKQKVFVVIARVEDDGHIGPENVIGVTPLSTFSPSVVSLFGGDEPATPEVTGPTRDEVRKLVEAETLTEMDMQSPDELGEPGTDARDAFDTHVDAATDERMKPPAPVRGTARTAVAATPEVTGGAVGLRQFEPPTVPGLRTSSIGGVVGENASKGGALMNVKEPEPEPVPDPAQVREEIRQKVVDETLAELKMSSPDELGATGESDRDAFEMHVNLVTDGRIKPARVRPMGPEFRLQALRERLAARGTVASARQKVLDEYGLTEAVVAEDPNLADKVARLVLVQLASKAGDLTAQEKMDQDGREADALATADAESARVARTRIFPGQQVDRRIVGRALGIANANSAELDRAFQSLIDAGLLVPSKLVETRDGVISRPTGYVMAEDSLDGLFEDNKVLVSAVPGAIGSDESFGRFGQMTLIGVVSNGTQALLRTRSGKQLRVVLSRLQLQIDVPGAVAPSEDGSAVEWDNMPGMETWSAKERERFIKEAQGPDLGNPLPMATVRNDLAAGALRTRLLSGQPVDEKIMANAMNLDQDWRTEQLFQQMVNQGLFIREPLQGGPRISLSSTPKYIVAFDAQDRSNPVLVRYTGNGLNQVMAFKGIDEQGRGEFDSTTGGKQQRYVIDLNGKDIVLVDLSGNALDPDDMGPWRPPPAEPPDGPVGPPKPPVDRPPTSGGDASGGGNDIVLPEVAVTRKRWYDGILRAFGTSNSLRFTNMLSNPMSTMNEFITQIGNVASLKAQARMAAGLEDRAGLSPSERKMTKEMSRGTTTLSDGTVIGWGSGIMDGMQMAMQVMRTGDMPEALIVEEKTGGRNRFVNQELLRDAWGREFGETGRKIGNVIGMPMRIRMANDILFATVGESIGIHMMANREAVRDGLEPDTKEYGNRVVQYADAIRDELYLGRKEAPARDSRIVPGVDAARIKRITGEASNIARNLVWQGEMKSMSFGLEQARWASPIMNFIIPFMQVGARIARAGADMTPGLGQALMGWDIARGDYGDPKAITSLKSLLASDPGMREDGSRDNSVRPASMRLAAQGMGLMVSGLGATLAMAGLLTGAGPDDDRERAAWLADGKRPYSLKIGGTYVNAALVLGPLAWPLIAGALIYDGATGKNKAVSPTSETWQNLAGATNEWIFNQTALSNLSRVIDATQNKGSGKNFERWIASSVVAPFVPYSSALRAISSASDDVKRDPQTFIDFMKMYFPGASQGVKAKTDDLFKAQGRTAAERYLPFVSSVEQASDRPYAVIGAKSQQEATRIRQAQTLVADYFRNPLTAPKPTDEDFTMVLRYGRNPSRYYDMQRKIGKLVAERTAVA